MLFKFFRWFAAAIIMLGLYHWVRFCWVPRPDLRVFFHAFAELVFGGLMMLVTVYDELWDCVVRLRKECGRLRRMDRIIVGVLDRPELTRHVATMDPRQPETNVDGYVGGVDFAGGPDLCSIVVLKKDQAVWEVVNIIPVHPADAHKDVDDLIFDINDRVNAARRDAEAVAAGGQA